MFSGFIPYLATSITAFSGGVILTAVTRTAVCSHLSQIAQRRTLKVASENRRLRQENAQLRRNLGIGD